MDSEQTSSHSFLKMLSWVAIVEIKSALLWEESLLTIQLRLSLDLDLALLTCPHTMQWDATILIPLVTLLKVLPLCIHKARIVATQPAVKSLTCLALASAKITSTLKSMGFLANLFRMFVNASHVSLKRMRTQPIKLPMLESTVFEESCSISQLKSPGLPSKVALLIGRCLLLTLRHPRTLKMATMVMFTRVTLRPQPQPTIGSICPAMIYANSIWAMLQWVLQTRL